MESRAIGQKASNNSLDIKARGAKDVNIIRNETKSVSYGMKSEFKGSSLASKENESRFPTGFGSTDKRRDLVTASAERSEDHSQLAERSVKYLGDKISSELNNIDRLSPNHPDSAKKLLDGSKPFILEDKILDKDDRSQLYNILRAINSNGNYYGNYVLPQGSDSYNSVLRDITAAKEIGNFFRNHGNGSKWQLEKIYVQVDQSDQNKFLTIGRYRSELDSYRVIGLFTPKNNFEKE